MMLSLDYQVGEQYLARSWDELLAIGNEIGKGEFEFDEKEVDWLEKKAKKAMELPVTEQIKMIGIPVAGIIILIIILYLTW